MTLLSESLTHGGALMIGMDFAGTGSGAAILMSSSWACSVKMLLLSASLTHGGALTTGMDFASNAGTPLMPAIPDQPPTGGGGGATGQAGASDAVVVFAMNDADAAADATPRLSASSAKSSASLKSLANILLFELGLTRLVLRTAKLLIFNWFEHVI